MKNDIVSEYFDYSDDENEESILEVEDKEEENDEGPDSGLRQALYCLPLYSTLSQSQQSVIFKEPPVDTRLCVVATNIAETSITIPNIKYVVDSGKVCFVFLYYNITQIITPLGQKQSL